MLYRVIARYRLRRDDVTALVGGDTPEQAQATLAALLTPVFGEPLALVSEKVEKGV